MHKKNSSWESSHEWYHSAVGEKGHYFHQQVVIPKLLPLLSLSAESELLDAACGQGVLLRHLPPIKRYVGFDISTSLIQEAQSYKLSKGAKFLVHDATQQLPESLGTFTHATLILALQNIADPKAALHHLSSHLKPGGLLALVLNHPCFRIPRQSGWHIDAAKKLQSRRIDRYFSSLEIPIATHPSEKERSTQTLSFHHPLSTYTRLLKEAGLVITDLEEWCSDKKSTGKMAAMEDRARKEFPLFLTLVAKKLAL